MHANTHAHAHTHTCTHAHTHTCTHATVQVAPAGKASEDEYVERYIFASQTPPPMMQLENKRVRQMCTPALETLHEVQDPSLGCCYAGGRSAQAPSSRP